MRRVLYVVLSLSVCAAALAKTAKPAKPVLGVAPKILFDRVEAFEVGLQKELLAQAVKGLSGRTGYRVLAPAEVEKDLKKKNAKEFAACQEERCLVDLAKKSRSDMLLALAIRASGNQCLIDGSIKGLRSVAFNLQMTTTTDCDDEALGRGFASLGGMLADELERGLKPKIKDDRTPAAPAAGTGPLTGEEILATLEGHRGPLKACLGKPPAALDPNLVVELLIEPEGRVAGVEPSDPGLKGSPLGACLAGVLRSVRFRTFDGVPTSVPIPLAQWLSSRK